MRIMTRNATSLGAILLMLGLAFCGALIPSRIAAGQAAGLQIAPVRTDITIDPGTEKSVTFTVRNMSTEPNTVKSSVYDFVADGSSGNPKVVMDDSAQATSIKPFVASLAPVDFNGGQTKDIVLKLKVPKDAAPGAYFGLLRFEAVPLDQTKEKANIGLTASVAPIVMIQVAGAISSDLSLTKFDVSPARSGIFLSPPKSAEIRLENNGKGFAKPDGTLSLYRGGSLVSSYELNPANNRGVVLPKSGRDYSIPIKAFRVPGKYRLAISVKDASGNNAATERIIDFWYLPIWLPLLAVALLAAAGVAAFLLVARRKRSYRTHE